MYNNISGDELAELRATLQYGIEAVRGFGSPRMDTIILLKLGQLFYRRAQETTRAVERGFLEARTQALFKFSLTMLRTQGETHSNASVPFRRLFKYASANSQYEIDIEINSLAEEAITFLAGCYFKSKEYEECIEEFSGIRLPFATYFQAESYRKLTELSNTPKKSKRIYLDRARECLSKTLDLLDAPNVDKNHPLKAIVDEDIKRLHTESRKIETNQTMSDSFVSANGRSDLDDSVVRLQREINSTLATPVVVNANIEKLERMIVDMMESLTLLKEDVADIRSKVNSIEEQVAKQPEAKSPDPLDEYYGSIGGGGGAGYPDFGCNFPMYYPKPGNGGRHQGSSSEQQQRNAAALMYAAAVANYGDMRANYGELGANYGDIGASNAPLAPPPFAGAQLPYGGKTNLLGLLQQPPPPQLQSQPPPQQQPLYMAPITQNLPPMYQNISLTGPLPQPQLQPQPLQLPSLQQPSQLQSQPQQIQPQPPVVEKLTPMSTGKFQFISSHLILVQDYLVSSAEAPINLINDGPILMCKRSLRRSL